MFVIYMNFLLCLYQLPKTKDSLHIQIMFFEFSIIYWIWSHCYFNLISDILRKINNQI
jgi:hypothetical protein